MVKKTRFFGKMNKWITDVYGKQTKTNKNEHKRLYSKKRFVKAGEDCWMKKSVNE